MRACSVALAAVLMLAGTRPLPAETRNYVLAITGRPADDWAKGADAAARREPARPASDCRTLMALLRQAPNLFVERLEQRVDLVAAATWGVQLSAGFSRDRALATYSRLAKQYSAVLAGHDPSLLSTTLRTRGSRPFYAVRVGADTREKADELCNRIRRAGGACLVLRNYRGAALDLSPAGRGSLRGSSRDLRASQRHASGSISPPSPRKREKV